jgi:hypothetical protein
MTEEMKQAPPVAVADASLPRRKKLLQTVGLALAAIVVVAVIFTILFGLLTHPSLTAGLRDVSIIALAFTSIVIGGFLVVLIFQLQSLIALLRNEIKPILESANQTASTVRGTTTFLSDAVVTPMITAASYASAVREAARLLLVGRRKRNSGRVRGEDLE